MSWQTMLVKLMASLALVAWLAPLASAQPPRAEVDAGDFSTEEHPPAASDAHGAAHGAGDSHDTAHGDTNPLAVDPDLAIFTLIIFLVLFFILGKFAWGPISAGLDQREKGIADNIAAAQASNEEARRLLAEYERKLASSQDEVRAIIDEARRDAEHTQQEILAKARSEAAAERGRALRDIETAKAVALKELAQASANMAVELAGNIVREKLSADDHARLINEAMARFPQGSASNN